MEKFYLEEPSMQRKEEAIDYVNEFIKFNSKLNGDCGLDKYVNNYEEWLMFLNSMKNQNTCPNNYCPGYEYFLIRENDSKIIGMINLRYNLNESLLLHGGHIGYSVRPTERKKGYNKINLYLCLLKAKELNLDKVLLTANEDNIGSIRTILSLGGILEDKDGILCRYWINVEDSIQNNKSKYKKYIRR